MAKINFNSTVSIEETKDIIRAVGEELTCVVISEPGVGKSSILKMLEDEMGTEEYDYIYIDCPVKDMMDIAASIPNHQTKTLEYYVSSLLNMGNGKAKVIMLDEFMKSPKLMQVIYTRLMLERMWGDIPLPVSASGKKSIVFATSNNTTDGVGDAMLDHAGNRVCKLHMSKSKVDVWNVWAGANGIARSIRAWAAMNPRAFASYLDGDQDDNPFIFRPNGGKQFVSPRSLAKSSVIVNNKSKLSENALAVALAGTIGEAAAKSLAAFIQLESKVTPCADVLRNPEIINIPSDVSVLVMMMLEAVDVIKTQDELTEYMKFVNRIPSTEVQSVFFTMMLRSRPKLARFNQSIATWANDNHFLM